MKRALVCTVLLGLAGPAHADRIKEIEVVENSKTTDATVILIADIEKGGDFKPEDIPEIEAKLVNSGLFKDVGVWSTPVVGGVKVTLRAKDKHSWVIAPTVYNQPTNKGGGLGFGENNLFGENKKLLLYAQVATGDSFFIGAYVDPSIAGTRFSWQYDVFLRRERVIEYNPPSEMISELLPVRQSKINYLNNGLKVGMNIARTAFLQARIRGAYVWFDNVFLAEGATPEQAGADAAGNFTDYAGNPCVDDGGAARVCAPGGEGWDFSSELILSYDGTANWYGITHGDLYRLSVERSLPQIGSDFDYIYGSAMYVRARKYFSRHNLVMKAWSGFGQDVPFQQEYTSGGTDLRGYKNRQLRGNLRTALNLEYSVPVLTIKGVALRLLGFVDSTYTAFVQTDDERAKRNYLPYNEHKGFAPWRNTVGVGTRVYVRQIVLPLLGLDLGYGLERRAYEIYFAVGLTGF
jgi:outer membrane protein assembly factor BamA